MFVLKSWFSLSVLTSSQWCQIHPDWGFASAQHNAGDQPSCLVARSVLSKTNASATHRAFGVFFWVRIYSLV